MPCRSGRQLLADAAADDGVALGGLAPDAVGRLVRGLARRLCLLSRTLPNAAVAFAATPAMAAAGAAGLNAAVAATPDLSDDACTFANTATQMGAGAAAAPVLAAAADGGLNARPGYMGSTDSEWAEWLRGRGLLPTRPYALPQLAWLQRALATPPLPPPPSPPPPPLLRPTPLYAFPWCAGHSRL